MTDTRPPPYVGVHGFWTREEALPLIATATEAGLGDKALGDRKLLFGVQYEAFRTVASSPKYVGRIRALRRRLSDDRVLCKLRNGASHGAFMQPALGRTLRLADAFDGVAFRERVPTDLRATFARRRAAKPRSRMFLRIDPLETAYFARKPEAVVPFVEDLGPGLYTDLVLVATIPVGPEHAPMPVEQFAPVVEALETRFGATHGISVAARFEAEDLTELAPLLRRWPRLSLEAAWPHVPGTAGMMVGDMERAGAFVRAAVAALPRPQTKTAP